MVWEQRLYAFLLRRVLGPYLSPSSLQKLHTSIEVSLQEGRFSLADIELNASFLSSKLGNISVHRVKIRKLQISLSLKEHQEDMVSTSVTWRAMNMARASAGISLMAHIEIDGLEIHLGRGCGKEEGSRMPKPPVANTESSPSSAAASMISSYIDSALASLRLCVVLKDVQTRVSGDNEWVEFNLSFAKYHDGHSQDFSMHKAIDFSGVSVLASLQGGESELVGKMNGGGQLSLRANNVGGDSSRLQQDVSFSFYQRINVSVGEASLKCFLGLADSFRKPEESPLTMEALEKSEYFEFSDEVILDDEKDVQTMKGIMEQYAEARQLAERHEIRGGILVPDDDSKSFDAFFDANELSFSKYRSTLEDSAILSPRRHEEDYHIHTQLKVFFRECHVKIAFPRKQSNFPVEYMLVSLIDLNASTSLSARSADVNISISMVNAETSQNTANGRPEIATLFSFDQDNDSNNLVANTPCLDIQWKSDWPKSSLDARLQSIQLDYDARIIRNCSRLCSAIALERSKGSSNKRPESRDDFPEVSVWFSGITVLLPITGVPETTFDSLFARCGYSFPEISPIGRARVGLTLEDVLLTLSNNADQNDMSVSSRGQQTSCQRALFFVAAPLCDVNGISMHRMDLLALTGQEAILLKKIRPRSKDDIDFPTVPSISSFKAREDNDIDDDETSGTMNSLRPPVPQPQILREARGCQEVIDLKIPELIFDLTSAELNFMKEIILGCLAVLSRDGVPKEKKPELTERATSCSLALNVTIDQVTACAHIDDSQSISFKVIGQYWRFFAVFHGSKVRCARMITHECDLYFASQLVYRESNKQRFEPMSTGECCDLIRHRTVRNADTKATPVFYRSQLFPSLSPESPAILFDMINDSDESCTEWILHLSFYNVTHRYDVESLWLAHLKDFVKPDEGVSETKDPPGSPGLTKLFVTFADCNIDYSTPKTFHRASRSLLRVSDFRFSSNLVSPPQPAQAFKLSVGDAAYLIGNQRHPYNAENASLSRSATILCPADLDVVNARDAPDLQQMNLITLLTLDCFVASIHLASAKTQSYMRDQALSEPNVATQLTVGFLCFYGCKDSYECFVDTIGDLNLKLNGLTASQIEALKGEKIGTANANKRLVVMDDKFYDSSQGEAVFPADRDFLASTLEEPAESKGFRDNTFSDSFELDGYDWTTIDHEWPRDELPPGEEQVARWYISDHDDDDKTSADLPTFTIRSTIGSDDGHRRRSKHLQLISHYIQLKPTFDPLGEGDMDAARHAGTRSCPCVNARIIIRDLSFRCRFFDGYDWPQSVPKSTQQSKRKYAFIIDHTLDKKERTGHETEKEELQPDRSSGQDRKKMLMGALLDLESSPMGIESAFQNIPLPEERGLMLMDQAEHRRLARRLNRFLQISVSGLKLRLDTFERSTRHRLASCLEMTSEDLFVAETISSAHPVKLLGEWFNETEHPRDTRCGLVLVKIVTWNPEERVTTENTLENDESEVVMNFLPLRCYIDQKCLWFARAFFTNDREQPDKAWAAHLTEIPPPKFSSFRVRTCKLKVNYTPEKVDVEALRDGSIVELVNLSPLNDMVITLQTVELHEQLGFGEAFSNLARSWIQDICSTQLHKFVTNSAPFQPFSSISTGAVDLVVLPWDAIQNKDSVSRALRTGVKSFAGHLIYETLNVSARLTSFAAAQLSCLISSSAQAASTHSSLPSRPPSLPRNVSETTGHAFESIAKGFETANYKVVIIPYREYRRSGPTGAVKSVVKGIPVAILAPLGAASEALSYALLGARNQLRPDIRKEEEASLKGLSRYSD